MRILIRGHRKLRNRYLNPFEPTTTWAYVQTQLRLALVKAQDKYKDLLLIHGGAIGTDTAAAWEAGKLGIPQLWVCPCRTLKEQASMWPGHIKTFMAQEIIPKATIEYPQDYVYIMTKRERFLHRNKVMIDKLEAGDMDISVWDGRKMGGTWAGNTYAFSRREPSLLASPVSFHMYHLHPYESPHWRTITP